MAKVFCNCDRPSAAVWVFNRVIQFVFQLITGLSFNFLVLLPRLQMFVYLEFGDRQILPGKPSVRRLHRRKHGQTWCAYQVVSVDACVRRTCSAQNEDLQSKFVKSYCIVVKMMCDRQKESCGYRRCILTSSKTKCPSIFVGIGVLLSLYANNRPLQSCRMFRV